MLWLGHSKVAARPLPHARQGLPRLTAEQNRRTVPHPW